MVDEYEHELVPSVPNTDSFDEGERQQEVEADEAANEAADENNNEDDSQAQQEVNNVATALAAERVSDVYLSSKEDERPASNSNSCPPAIHRRSQVMTERGAIAIVTIKPTRTMITGNHVLLNGSGCPRLTMVQHPRSAGSQSRGLPANLNHAPNLVGALSNLTLHLIRVREPPRSPIPRVSYLLRRYLHHKPQMETYRLTATTLTDRLELSSQR